VLRALDVRDFAIVERVGLELGAGFTVLTGETGAGKSILVDAIELLVGGRGDSAAVRDGAERAELSAEFDLDAKAPLSAWLEERELAGDPGTLILRRTIDRSGRSRCFVNGHAATLAQLREAGEFLLDIHGQHEHQSLLRPAVQRSLLDAHAGAETIATETAEAWRNWKRLQALAEDAAQQFARREAERSDLEERAAELKRLAPRAGEWEEVSAQHLRLSGGQVELLLPDIDPHVLEPEHQVRVAGQPEAHDVEEGGELLVGDLHVDMLQRHDVAHVLGGPVVRLARHGSPPPDGVVRRASA